MKLFSNRVVFTNFKFSDAGKLVKDLLPFSLLFLFIYSNDEFGNYAVYTITGLYYFKTALFLDFIFILLILTIYLLSVKTIKVKETQNKILIIILLLLIAWLPYQFNFWWWKYYGDGPSPLNQNYSQILLFFNIITALGILSYFFLKLDSEYKRWTRYGLILLVFCLIKINIIMNFPIPRIDVWDILMKGSIDLLHGINPYGAIYRSQGYGYIENYYPYPPGVLLLLLPIRLLGQDIRFFYIICELGTSLIIYWYLGKTERAELYSFLFFIMASTDYLLHYGWTELFIIMFVVALVLYGDKNVQFHNKTIQAWYWRPLLFAFIATLKQTLWLVEPFYAVYILKRSNHKAYEFISSIGLFLLIVLPFLIWNPATFFYDVWTWHANQPIRIQSMTVNSLLASIHVIGISEVPMVMIAIFVIIYLTNIILFFFWDRITKKNLEFLDVFKFSTIMMFLFLLWGSLAYMNHYFLIIALFCAIYLKSMDQPITKSKLNDQLNQT